MPKLDVDDLAQVLPGEPGDATYLHVRENHQVVSKAVVIATRVRADGFQGASRPRCRVHTMRKLMPAAHHSQRQVIAALIRTIFVQPDHKTAVAQLRAVVDQLNEFAPAGAEKLQAMETDLLAYTGFPPAHWFKIWSNNPIERLNRELKRRTDVVGIFPNTESVIPLVDALLVEVNDEMIAAEHRHIAASLTPVLEKGHQPPSLPAAPRNQKTESHS